MTMPLKPLSGNWAYNNRLNDWQIAPAPINRQLPNLPKRVKDNRFRGSKTVTPSQKMSPEKIVDMFQAAFGTEWVTVAHASKILNRATSFLRERLNECVRLKLFECKAFKIKPEGCVERLAKHYRVKK